MAGLEKHTPFFNLIDAVNSGDCPVCYCVSLRVRQFFESLLYQNVNNLELRAELRANGGFCHTHAHELGSYNDGLAVAVMHLELLEAAERNNGVVPASGASLRPSPRLRRGLFQRGRRESAPAPAGCPVCRVAEEQAANTISLVQQYGEDGEFITAFRQSPGLCLPHLQRYLNRNRNPAAAVMDHQQQRLTDLIARTRAFIDGENATSHDRSPLSRE
ncbi:MAG: hypothetical protein EA428_14695, partial [Spirochaetaceae bacterium]